jgi:hypothetical protein
MKRNVVQTALSYERSNLLCIVFLSSSATAAVATNPIPHTHKTLCLPLAFFSVLPLLSLALSISSLSKLTLLRPFCPLFLRDPFKQHLGWTILRTLLLVHGNLSFLTFARET